MGESVKLSNGKYIDTEGIWDNTQGKLQSEINNGGEIHTVDLASAYPSHFTQGTLKWVQIGRVVYVLIIGVIFKSTAQINLSLSTLGLPTATMGCYVAGSNGTAFRGCTGINGNVLQFNPVSNTYGPYASLTYIV